MAGDWRAGPGTDLADLLTPFAARLTTLVPRAAAATEGPRDRRVPRDQENTLDGARSNIAAHYDLSNDLFAAFLDPTMTYSSAWFDESEPVQTATRLEEAQLRKIDGILDLAGVRDGTRLLEIGTGWGALAIRAAQRGARVTTITLSREQMRLARERVGSRRPVRARRGASAGLPRGRRRVRRHRQRRDDRGRRGGLLANLLRGPRPASRSGRQGRHPGNHHGPRAFPRHPAQLQLDPEVHLPRRHHPVLAGGRRRARGPHHAARDAAARTPGALRPDPAPVAGTLPRPVAPHPRPGLRRDLPPHVGVLPRLQRGRLPQRLPRREPAPADPRRPA